MTDPWREVLHDVVTRAAQTAVDALLGAVDSTPSPTREEPAPAEPATVTPDEVEERRELPVMRAIRGVGCSVCDTTLYGPNGGDYGLAADEFSVWEYLLAEAESFGWFTIVVYGRSTLVCSVDCASKWLHGDTEHPGLSFSTGNPTFRRCKAEVIREKLAEHVNDSFSAADIVRDAKTVDSTIRYGEVYQILRREVAKNQLVKTGEGKNSRYFVVREEDFPA